MDGYLLVFDVSNVKGRNVNKQMEFVQKLHSSISRTKKPIVIVATKFDAVEETSLSSLRQFAREKKLSIVECSSQLNINVNLPFCTLAAMIDKNRSKPREMSYQEAFRRREERVAAAKKKYTNLLEFRVTDYRSIWSNTKAELEKLDDYQGHVVIAGTKSAKKLFRNHTKRLKEDHQQHKQNMYLANMPSMLMEIYPDLEAINGRYVDNFSHPSRHIEFHWSVSKRMFKFHGHFFFCREKLPPVYDSMCQIPVNTCNVCLYTV